MREREWLREGERKESAPQGWRKKRQEGTMTPQFRQLSLRVYFVGVETKENNWNVKKVVTLAIVA